MLRKSKFSGFVFLLSLLFILPKALASDISFCLEADCSSVTVTLGEQIHPSKLNCSNLLKFTDAPAGTYAYSGSGCGQKWNGSITVDGESDYMAWFCPSAGGACCSDGCDSGGNYRCDECGSGRCPLAKSLKEEPDLVDLLRSFRQNVLRNSLTGVALISLYYDSVPEIERIMKEDPELKERTKAFVEEIAPLLNQCLVGSPVNVDPLLLMAADDLLAAYQERGNKTLQNDLEKLRKELSTGELIDKLCN